MLLHDLHFCLEIMIPKSKYPTSPYLSQSEFSILFSIHSPLHTFLISPPHMHISLISPPFPPLSLSITHKFHTTKISKAKQFIE